MDGNGSEPVILSARVGALRDDVIRLKADVARLINERAALLAKILIPDWRNPGGWLVMERCGSNPSYRIFMNREDAEQYLFGHVEKDF